MAEVEPVAAWRRWNDRAARPSAGRPFLRPGPPVTLNYMRAPFALAAAFAVSACAVPTAGPNTPDYAAAVAAIRVAHAATVGLVAVEIARGGLPPIQVTQIRQAEADQAPIIAPLSPSSSPETVSTALGDTAALTAALPPNQVPVPVQGALATAQVKFLADQQARENAETE